MHHHMPTWVAAAPETSSKEQMFTSSTQNLHEQLDHVSPAPPPQQKSN